MGSNEMAGDWIAMTHNLCDKPEVRRIARKTGVTIDEAVGKLHRFWCWLDVNSIDGVVDGVVSTDVDDIVRLDGFSSALVESEWAFFDDKSEKMTVPNFGNYNGETAKKRMQKNKRQARWRNKNSDLGDVDGVASTQASQKTSTREEKRRDKKNKQKKFDFKSELIKIGVDDQVASDYLSVRSKKKAANTETAFKRIKSEIEKSCLTPNQAITQCVERSWSGFNSAWVDGGANKSEGIKW